MTFLNMPYTITELYFRGCPLIDNFEADFLKPFINLDVFSFCKSANHISLVLGLLYPFEYRNMSKIEFTRVNAGNSGIKDFMYPNSIVVTSDMMKHLQTMCVQIFVLAENGIVDFQNRSLLYYDNPSCFREIVFTGNIFSIINGGKLSELVILLPQLTNLETFDMSYIPLQFTDVTYKSNNANFDLSSAFHAKDSSEIEENYVSDCLELGNCLVETFRNQIFTFTMPPKLQNLRISHHLSSIKSDTKIKVRNVSNLRRFDVSYFRKFEHLPDIEFEGHHNITHIDLSGINSTIIASKSSMPLLENVHTLIWQNANLRQVFRGHRNIFNFGPLLQVLDIGNNYLWYLPKYVFINNTWLRKLSLDYNFLPEIPLAVTYISNLQELSIQHNFIQEINTSVCTWLDEQNEKVTGGFKLILHGNIFRCTCETKDFILWIVKTKVILDKAKRTYKCRLSNGTSINTLTVFINFHELFAHCDTKEWLQIGIALLLAFVVLVIPVALIVNFRWRIAFWVYERFRKVIMKKHFKYDIYFSYGHDSLWWIQDNLIHRLENIWDMTTCLEDRDFVAGSVCADEISESIGKSRNVIFVVTDTFKDRIWGQYEVERAKYERYTKNLQNIIVITRGVDVENFPVELGHILNKVFLIEWTEQGTDIAWDKLRMALFPKVA